MYNHLLEKAAELMAQETPFALATVVRRERPTSADPGAKAIITLDGTFFGWVGGSCAQPTVLNEALKTLEDGQPRLVVITPHTEEATRPGTQVFQMTCYSGGTLDIYIEPYLPAPQLLLFGVSPITEAMTKLGKVMGFKVCVIDPSATRERFAEADALLAKVDAENLGRGWESYAVVATMGHWDEQALKEAIALDTDYVGLVASKKRFAAISAQLRADGLSEDQLAAIRCPAGVDIAATAMEEIALSVLAEVVSLRRRGAQETTKQKRQTPRTREVPQLEMATDPVCHMAVDLRTAQHTVEHAGTRYYFCCRHCQHSFEQEPGKYV